jgi:hypothetical protein
VLTHQPGVQIREHALTHNLADPVHARMVI